MDIRHFVCLSLVCMWCSLHAGRSPLVVTAQLTLDRAAIRTPIADRKEGGDIDIYCESTGIFLPRNFDIEWRKNHIILNQDEGTVTSDPRLSFVLPGYEFDYVKYGELTITGVHRDDSGIYTCNLIDKRVTTGDNIIDTLHVPLYVLYFPSESFPVCSPDGPITAVAGTELNLQCSSEVGNPQVMMEIIQTNHNDVFTLSHHGDMISMSLALTADTDYNGILFACTITSPLYFPYMSHSCYIGPINVTNAEEPPTTLNNLQTASQTFPLTTGAAASSVPLLSGLVAASLLLLVSFIVIVVLAIVNLRQKRQIKSRTPAEPVADTHIDLQSTSKNTAHMEPVIKGAEDAAEEHTYSQAIEVAPE